MARVTHQDITDEPRTLARHLTLRLSSTRRGARLARKLAVQQLAEWTGLPHDADATQAVALVTAELAANAITHGRVPGRDFRLTLRLSPDVVRIEVTDTRPERTLPQPAPERTMPSPDAAAGRGLFLVDACAARWGCTVHDAYTKTVWAEVSLQPPTTALPLRTGHAPAKAADRTYATEDVSRQPPTRKAPQLVGRDRRARNGQNQGASESRRDPPAVTRQLPHGPRGGQVEKVGQIALRPGE